MSESETKSGSPHASPQAEREREHERRNELQALKIQEAIARMRRRRPEEAIPDARGASAGQVREARERSKK